jgi:hypothetical protein
MLEAWLPKQERAKEPNAKQPVQEQAKAAPNQQPAKKPTDPKVTDAIKALGKVNAAVEVGVNFQEYGRLLIDAKAAVNEAQEVFPDEKIKENVNGAMKAYLDAQAIHTFGVKFLLENPYGLSRKWQGDVISNYRLDQLPEIIEDSKRANLGKDVPASQMFINSNLAIKAIWKVAAERLAKARKLQKR